VRKLLDVPFDEGDVGHAAAFGALPAVDLGGNLLGSLAKLAFHEFVRLQVTAELQVLGALLLA
jgi:hypothetical protein